MRHLVSCLDHPFLYPALVLWPGLSFPDALFIWVAGLKGVVNQFMAIVVCLADRMGTLRQRGRLSTTSQRLPSQSYHRPCMVEHIALAPPESYVHEPLAAYVREGPRPRSAAEHGFMLLEPHTSHQGHREIQQENRACDFGTRERLYVHATEPKQSAHYKMCTYVTKMLRQLMDANLPADLRLFFIFGHFTAAAVSSRAY